MTIEQSGKSNFVQQYLRPMLMDMGIGVADCWYMASGLSETVYIVTDRAEQLMVSVSGDSKFALVQDVLKGWVREHA